MSNIEKDELVPDPPFYREMGISPMTAWRRTKGDPEFPRKIKQGSRNYRSRRQIEEYKQKLIARAMEDAR